jgi:hypothetical protein
MPFVTGSDVQAAKNRLHPSFVATNSAVHECTTAPPASKLAWDVFYGSWEIFFRDDETTILNQLSAGGRADLAEQYGKDLLAWQNQILTWRCPLLSPPVSPTSNQPLPVLQQAQGLKPATDLVQSIAILGGVLLLGYVAVVYVPKFLPSKGAA